RGNSTLRAGSARQTSVSASRAMAAAERRSTNDSRRGIICRNTAKESPPDYGTLRGYRNRGRLLILCPAPKGGRVQELRGVLNKPEQAWKMQFECGQPAVRKWQPWPNWSNRVCPT